MKHRPGDLRRRDFLRGGVAATLGLSTAGLESLAGTPPPRVRRYRPLGRTGLEISDISFGSSRTRDPQAARHALSLGVNYFDTAESYPIGRGEDSEEALGEALAGARERVVLASKTHAGARDRRDRLMRNLEGSLRRLRTDRIDVYFNHAVNDVERLRNPEWFEFTERARQQGKIRFTGISGHAGRLIPCLDHALDHDLVDVVLVAYNFGQDPAFYERFVRRFDFVAVQPDLPRVLAKAHRKGVGVVAMKTLLGARLNDLRAHERPGGTFAQAAFRWVLASPHVDALVVTMKTREQVDEYLAASGGTQVSEADGRLLARYLERNGRSQCRPGCGACQGSCPHDVPIGDVLRSRMYAVDYGDLEMGRGSYAALGTDASACLGCAGSPCLAACSHGLEVPALTRDAARRLG